MNMSCRNIIIALVLCTFGSGCTNKNKPLAKSGTSCNAPSEQHPSAKKDYHKIALEFERSLPSSMEYIAEQISDLDHYVYYKKSDNSQLIKFDLEDRSKEVTTPPLKDGQHLVGIYAGKNNIMFVAKNEYSELFTWLYNLRALRFKELDVTGGIEQVGEVYFEENNQIVNFEVCLKAPNYKSIGPTYEYKYDFDGHRISERQLDPGTYVEVPGIESE